MAKTSKTSKTSKTWKTIDDNKVQHIWTCDDPDCCRSGVAIVVPPTFYMYSGIPICNNCGEDLAYQRTEINA